MFFTISVLLLSLFDIVATHYQIVVYGGSFSIEANPAMRFVMENFGLRGAYVFRMIMPSLGLAALFWVRRQNHRLGQSALVISLLAHVALAFYHLYLTEFFTIHE